MVTKHQQTTTKTIKYTLQMVAPKGYKVVGVKGVKEPYNWHTHTYADKALTNEPLKQGDLCDMV